MPSFFVPSSLVLPNNHSLKLSFCASIAAPTPNKAPPIGPAGPNANPNIPELVNAPIEIAPTPAPIPNIPASLPPRDNFDSAPLWNLPNILFTVFIKPNCPLFSSPNMNFLNISDLVSIVDPIPINAPAIGPPTNIPSNPPPVIVPLIRPKPAPPASNLPFFLK